MLVTRTAFVSERFSLALNLKYGYCVLFLQIRDFGLSRIKRDTLVDVFSYGISKWEILTGEEPYADMHCGAIIGGIVKNTLQSPIPEYCHPDWRKLMEQCWSHDPESRPSFTEIKKRL
ncbi:hypothetical protein F3Y22_tig00110346pilonHSYRG00144 [Hibiscus syriacus]|uniref:Protein kinase domain-containing protein n=1 Tax=Hibiscus syriacus TaxID=106335 RepID=A0A6A3AUF5_HIBSY|nr:hypothetical protein F3Y22_tig00110346pilonHSYRG00144 [Hibiscus syriacus]